jgi:hypothetical protein
MTLAAYHVLNPGEYVIPCGEYQGQKIRDVPTNEVLRIGYEWTAVTPDEQQLQRAARLVSVYGVDG